MHIKLINIAIFSGEAKNTFELCTTLRYAPRFKVVGLSSQKGHSHFEFEHHREDLPHLSKEIFLSNFCRILKEEGIRYIFPKSAPIRLRS